jgi:hypothetical protein
MPNISYVQTNESRQVIVFKSEALIFLNLAQTNFTFSNNVTNIVYYMKIVGKNKFLRDKRPHPKLPYF